MRVRSLRRIAFATLIGWVAVLAAPVFLPHALALDLICSEERVSGADAADVVAADTSADGNGHCVVCHLQRAVREAVAEPPRALPRAQPATPGAVAPARSIASGLPVRIPARAPPDATL